MYVNFSYDEENVKSNKNFVFRILFYPKKNRIVMDR